MMDELTGSEWACSVLDERSRGWGPREDLILRATSRASVLFRRLLVVAVQQRELCGGSWPRSAITQCKTAYRWVSALALHNGQRLMQLARPEGPTSLTHTSVLLGLGGSYLET